MDRDAKLAAAKKKLRQFKRKKIQKKNPNLFNNVVQEYVAANDLNDSEDVEIKKSEEFIDEKFDSLHRLANDDLMQSTAATTENILQVSAKLNGLAAEAKMFIDNDNNDKFQNHSMQESNSKSEESLHHQINILESRNREFAANLSSLSQDNDNLNRQCQHLTAQLSLYEMKPESHSNGTNNDEVMLQDQIQVQMQTIGVLVSEKQDLKQEISSLQAQLQASMDHQNRLREEMHMTKEKMILIERENKNMADSLALQEKLIAEIQTDYGACEKALSQAGRSLETEKMQSIELTGKLQTREAEYVDLYTAHSDLCEKFEMAEILLQQMSPTIDHNTASQMSQVQQDKEALNLKVAEYQQAFEHLTLEREQLKQQYADTHEQWRIDMQRLQSQVNTLECEKQDISNLYNQAKSSLQNETMESTKMETEDGTFAKKCDDLHQQLEEALQTICLMKDEITTLQSTNQHFSKLVQEKESCIYDLENKLELLKVSISEHEQLLDGTRSDKATISRALLQNKQLKEQLEEIQQGFICMSNDKMDLATLVGSLEHSNKDLQACLDKKTTLYHQTKQELEDQREENLHLQKQNASLQSSISSQNSEQLIVELNKENHDLRERLKTLAKEGLVIRDIDSGDMEPSTPNGTANASEFTSSNGGDDETIPFVHTNLNDTELVSEVNEEYKPLVSEHSAPAVVVSSEDKDNEGVNPMGLLQDKFMAVMREKADLLNRLELMEHTNEQLQNECDTIGEYIALYHNQRQILKQRHREKDEYISSIIQERVAMQGKVEQLQTLIIAMLNNRHTDHFDCMSSPRHHHEPQDDTTHSNLSESESSFNGIAVSGSPKQAVQLEQPDLVPKSDVSVTYGASEGSRQSTMPGYSRKVTSSESSGSENDQVTTSQILNLLEQMQKPTDLGMVNQNSIPSGFCMRYTGLYTAI